METITIRLGNDTQQRADIQAIKLRAHNMAGAALDMAKMVAWVTISSLVLNRTLKIQ